MYFFIFLQLQGRDDLMHPFFEIYFSELFHKFLIFLYYHDTLLMKENNVARNIVKGNSEGGSYASTS